MASLEEALTQSVDNEPIAPVNDVLVIDPEKRLINVPDSESLFGVFGENIVERKYFTCPRIVLNNIDLFECYIFINYISASGRIGYIQADDVVLDETENYIVFSWELTSNVFDKNMDSIIYFSVSAKQYVDDREPVFATRKAQGKMYETVNGTELIQEQYADIILQLLAKMDGVEQIATPEAMQAYVDNWLKENPSAIGGQPVPVESASGMLNTQTLYLYMGQGETVDGVVYERGYVYYYVEDTQSWTKGSLYGGEGGGSSFSGNASDVSYDDTETKLGATNVQEAVGRLSETIVNLTTSGLTTAQVNALDGMFKVCAYIQGDVSTQYNAFKNAFGITENGGTEEPDEPITPDEPTDTSPQIAEYDKGFYWGSQMETSDYTGACVTIPYTFTQDIESLKANANYDTENDYMTGSNMFPKVTYYVPNTKFLENGNSVVSTKTKVALYRDDNIVNIATLTTGQEKTTEVGVKNKTDCMYCNGIAFTLFTDDIEDSYAYWTIETGRIAPIGVENGDIIFAGKNTQYYRMKNIDGTLV